MEDKPNTIRTALNSLKEEIVGTPLKRCEPSRGPGEDSNQMARETDAEVPEGDLPGQLIRFLGKSKPSLLMSKLMTNFMESFVLKYFLWNFEI